MANAHDGSVAEIWQQRCQPLEERDGYDNKISKDQISQSLIQFSYGAAKVPLLWEILPIR